MLNKYIKPILKSATLGGAVALLAVVTSYALPYGASNYGECQYGESCPADITTTPSDTTTTEQQISSEILLNDYPEYFSASGVQLDLKIEQIIYFNVETSGGIQKHSVTIKAVGADYVDITIDIALFNVRLFVGDSKRFDVTGDGIADIEITLRGISGDKAQMTFKVLGEQTKKPAKTPAVVPGQSSTKSNVWPMFFAVLVVLGLLILLVMYLRRRQRKTPTNW